MSGDIGKLKNALEGIQQVIREKKRGLYPFYTNYDANIDNGFDSATTGFYMALEELGLKHIEYLETVINQAIAQAESEGGNG